MKKFKISDGRVVVFEGKQYKAGDVVELDQPRMANAYFRRLLRSGDIVEVADHKKKEKGE